MGMSWVSLRARLGPLRGKRGLSRGIRPKMRWTVEVLIWSNFSSSRGEISNSSWAARWLAIQTRLGVRRSGQR